MSDSRLEKFIYAICSMDVSDLPVPLSRIEKLWNCLITGETPDFEPLSRNEKYLMAMLDRYDISNLPAPMSRGEKLLYKIAVGETDLSDVPGYLSRYEELLKYLIENGGISRGDFEYVLYTLNQSLYTLYTTAEKPVKSAILSGKTLVNLHHLENYQDIGVVLDGGINQHFGKDTSYATWRMYDISMLKPNTEYGVFCWVLENTISEKYWDGHVHHASDTVFNPSTELRFSAGETGLKFAKLTTISDFTGKTCGIRHLININTPSSEYVKFRCVIVEYQEGMENWDIPYFEGMQSVKVPVLTTTGKNLWRTDLLNSVNFNNNYYVSTDYTLKQLCPGLIVGETYTVSMNYQYTGLINGVMGVVALTPFTVLSYKPFIYTEELGNSLVYLYGGNANGVMTNFQVEKGTVVTPYEPYKSNILTLNEEVELCGIGDVKDELDLITGELTQRIGECSLDGSSNSGKWVIRTDVYIEGYIYFQQELNYILQSENIAICDRLPYSNQSHISSEQLRLSVYNNGTIIGVRLSKSKGVSSLDEFSEYLKSNPIKFKYPLATASIKTVDLTVVDQDNQPTELGTFENVTHVSLVAENLIPEVEMEVATRISTELASASPLMDDISNNQQRLEVTMDEQSDNVDATMIATTEIYEETLQEENNEK